MRPVLAYGTVRGTVRDGVSNAVLAGATITVVEAAKSFISYPTGKYGYSPTTAGAYTLHVTAFGYAPADVSVNIVNGVNLVRDIVLQPLPSVTLSGVVRRALDSAPLQYASVTVTGTNFKATADAAGAYSIASVPQGNYTVIAELPGYAPASSSLSVVNSGTATRDFALTAATFYDNAETNLGWTLGVLGDNATTGIWIRANPVGSQNGTAQPEDDHSPAPSDVTCFVTANGPVGGSVGAADVDNGKTTLLSPTFNMSATTDPELVWWQWYYDAVNSNSIADTLLVDLSGDNGVTWKRVEALATTHNFWERVQVRVLDYLTPTSTMRMRVVAADLGAGDIVEAAIDDIEFYPAALVTNAPDPAPMPGASPLSVVVAGAMPSRGPSQVRFTLAQQAPVAAQVYDMAGRLVRSLGVKVYAPGSHPLGWDGRYTAGRQAPAGVYQLRLSTPGAVQSARLVRFD